MQNRAAWEHDADQGMSREILNTLMEAYPLLSWDVEIKGGCVIIKSMEIDPQWGMLLHYKNLAGDAKVRKKAVTMAAGEFLERCHKRLNDPDAPIEGAIKRIGDKLGG